MSNYIKSPKLAVCKINRITFSLLSIYAEVTDIPHFTKVENELTEALSPFFSFFAVTIVNSQNHTYFNFAFRINEEDFSHSFSIEKTLFLNQMTGPDKVTSVVEFTNL